MEETTTNNTNPEQDSIHNRIEQIIKETDVDRKSQISSKIAFGDSFVKIALLTAFWGFLIFWAIVALAGL